MLLNLGLAIFGGGGGVGFGSPLSRERVGGPLLSRFIKVGAHQRISISRHTQMMYDADN